MDLPACGLTTHRQAQVSQPLDGIFNPGRLPFDQNVLE